MIYIIESLSDDKFNQIKKLANKYNYKFDEVHNKPYNFILKSNKPYGFAITYRTQPAMIKPDIYIGGVINRSIDLIDRDVNELNIAIKLAKEIKDIIDK